jgi:hypothetical protein
MEQLGLPVSTLNDMVNKKELLQQCADAQSGRKKLKLQNMRRLDHYSRVVRQKWALNMPVQGHVFRQKAEEIALKLNIEFTSLNG